jgi:hypothetical protein
VRTAAAVRYSLIDCLWRSIERPIIGDCIGDSDDRDPPRYRLLLLLYWCDGVDNDRGDNCSGGMRSTLLLR